MPTDPYRYVLSVDGHDIELADGEVTIGRSRTSTVRIDHESVSRSHALLTLERGQAVVKDLNSSNGTYVGGRRVLNETRLSDGDRIQLGAAVIAYRLVHPTRSEKTALIDAEMATAGPPPAAVAQIDASPAAPISPDTGGSEAEPPSPPKGEEPEGPQAPPPLEITATGLEKGPRAGDAETPVAAHAALEAVRAKGEPPPPPPPPPEPPRQLIRIPAPPKPAASPVPPPPPPAPNLASVPFRGTPRAHGASPAPVPELRSAAAAAGFFVRLLAQVVDGVVLTAVNIVLLSPVFLILFFRGELQSRESGPDVALVIVTGLCALLIVAANLWYVVGGWAKTGRTPGKSLLKLSVVVPGTTPGSGIGWKKAFVRALATVLSSALLGIGHLMVLFRRDRRALHDLIAGTVVVRSS